MDLPFYWTAIALLGLGTFAIRLSFIQILDRPPEGLQRLLRFIPAAVLPAIIAPALCLPAGQVDLGPGNPRLIAGIVAALIAWRTGNMLVSIAAGMGVLWLAQAAGPLAGH